MNRLNAFCAGAILLGCLVLTACAPGSESREEVDTETITPYPAFTVGVRALEDLPELPYLHSCAWARQGAKVLLIGGRIDGFHGLSERDTVFKTSRANTSLFVIDFDDFSYSELPLDPQDASLLPFSASNMEFCQEGDTLYLAGGYGRQNPSDPQSNFTIDQLTVLRVSAMIDQVERGVAGDPKAAILQTVNSPYVQVSGGEMAKRGSYLYLMFGQKYPGAYALGVTGTYTSAVRRFRLQGNQLIDTTSIRGDAFHRRDLSVEEVIQNSGNFYAAYGGVFTADDDGYEQPVKIFLDDAQMYFQLDTLHQKTNQYDCARISVYDENANANVHVLLGGIGKYQYDEATGRWEDGDNGAKLPFVKTITQMIWQDGRLTQHIQLPPGEPELPEWLGTNALFVARPEWTRAPNAINFSKLTADTTSIGWLYGGIRSQRPTSSRIYPTSVNRTVYEVFLYKRTAENR